MKINKPKKNNNDTGGYDYNTYNQANKPDQYQVDYQVQYADQEQPRENFGQMLGNMRANQRNKNNGGTMRIGKQGKDAVILRRMLTPAQKTAWTIRIVALVALIVWLVVSQNNMIVTKKYVYTSTRVPKTFVGYTIVNVSDLHNTSLNVVSKVSKCNPDLIVVSGGLTDDTGDCVRSVNTIKELASLAPTLYVTGDNDEVNRDAIKQYLVEAVCVEDKAILVEAPNINQDTFIKKYLGEKVIEKYNAGDEDAVNYVNYTRSKLDQDIGKTLMVSGFAFGENEDKLLDKIYEIIGTDKSIFQVNLCNQVSVFNTLSYADIDIVFGGQTHGDPNIVSGFKKGLYPKNGTTLFLSAGVGNLSSHAKRLFNYPEILEVKLSDGTIKDENPLEKFLGNYIVDVKTKFDNDQGFKEYTYRYGNTHTYEAP